MATEHGQVPERVSEGFLRHLSDPRGLGRLGEPHGRATGVGQCGDSVEVSLKVADGAIAEVRALPMGCLYTQVCASALCELAAGRSLEGALAIEPEDIERLLDGLPEDHRHCARLAVNTMGEAIEDYYRRQRPAGERGAPCPS